MPLDSSSYASNEEQNKENNFTKSYDKNNDDRYYEFEIKRISKIPGIETFDLQNLVLLSIKDVT